MKIESKTPWHFIPPVDNFNVDISDLDNFAVPKGPLFIPVESGDMGNDVLF